MRHTFTRNADIPCEEKTVDEQPPLQPLRVVIRRAAEEADSIASSLMKLEEALGPIVSETMGNVEELQELDFARQGIEGLSIFLAELISSVDSEAKCCPYQATKNLGLRAQRQRLIGRSQNILLAAKDDTELW